MQKISKALRIIIFLYILPLCCFASQSHPEAATKIESKSLAYAKSQMAVTNNKWATKAALEILNQGGNAFDAAIAASFVLGLTEPQSSGIGGGGYALTYNSKTKELIAYDGREVAPLAAEPNWFLDESGQPLTFIQAMMSAKAVGVPSEVALLYKLHQKQGKLAWAKLLQPAITLAENGFPMSPRLYKLLSLDKKYLVGNQQITNVYFESGDIKLVGNKVINKEYANTLKQIAQNPQTFYTGKIARDIIKAINQKAGKTIYTSSDLANYKVTTKPGLCTKYRDKYNVCSIPPSSGGGIAVLELIKIFANKYNGVDVNDINWVYHFSQASKLAFADRDQYIADPKFVKQTLTGLLGDGYIKSRSQLIGDTAFKTPVAAGIPQGIDPKYAADTSQKRPGTTSLAIVDKYGNAITMTVTVEHQFGSHIFVDGFFLNNELTDFSFTPTGKNGKIIANRVEAGKRPRSSMTPVMVFESGGLELLTGSPGGGVIICYVAKNLIQVLDFKMNIADAIATPNLCSLNGALIVEKNSSLSVKIPQLEVLGESVVQNDLVSGVTSIKRAADGGWYGAADPRREGVASGL